MLKFMLDTNIAIYVIKRKPIEVLATFNLHADRFINPFYQSVLSIRFINPFSPD